MAFKLQKGATNVNRGKKKSWRLTPLQFQFLMGFVLFVAVALLITLVWYVTRIPSFQIEHIEVVGGETLPHSIIEEKVQNELSGAYLRIVPHRFTLFYPKEKIVESIMALDRVKNVHVERGEDQTLIVAFDEYVPYALWCASHDSRTCLFMDKTGLAFAEAPFLQGSAFVRYINEGANPQVDATGFDSSFVTDTGSFIEQLETRLALYVTHVFKRSTYDVEYTISGGGVIKVSQSIPMDESFKNLETILFSDAFKHIEPGSFQYIDLRFGEKIFVNEELPTALSATSSEATASTTASNL